MIAGGVSAKQGATVLCSGIKSSHELAVFANGVMMRYLDFNDGYITPMGGGHPSDTIAALLSSAEFADRSGRDLILATALAYEVFCKVADVLDTRTLGLDQATMLGLAFASVFELAGGGAVAILACTATHFLWNWWLAAMPVF